MKLSLEPSSHLVKGMAMLAFVISLPLGYQLWQNARAGGTFSPQPVTRPGSLLTVMVSGEVANPGVYDLNPGTNIRQLLNIAEPRFPASLMESPRLDQIVENRSHYQFSSRLEAGIRVIPLGVREKLVLSIPIDLNSASAEELDLLPYVSRNAARMIVEYRQKNGAIRDIDELTRIKGLGPRLIEVLKRHTSVDEK